MTSVRPNLRVIFLTAFVFLLLFGFGCQRRASPVASPAEQGKSVAASDAGSQAASFRLSSLAGKKVELKDFRGKNVVIHFWASWCPPCLPELPHVISFASQMKSQGWLVLAISTDTDWKKARDALPAGQDLPENFVVLLDTDAKVAEEYGTYMYPESYWVTPEGRVRHKWVGPQDWENLSTQLKSAAK